MFSPQSSNYKSGTSETESTRAQVDGGGGSAETRPPRERGATEDELLELESAWLRAVALTWEDPAQLARLKGDPREFLMACCSYTLPPGIELTLREAREPGSPSGNGWRFCEQRKGWDPSASAVTLYIPPPPELSERPVALAELASDASLSVLIC
ncbi:BMA_0021/BMA_0022 family TOMM bacteriocin [Sorangium sp. So ce1014]|uniref:BMA_0021/BMA_0022 family TOMM bacteriocin n=1 Tax=Sorangium sp. So ce1014 TaxID=3133326 RepID=UPI003F61E1C7